MIEDLLDTATANIQDIADESGISYDTLWAWKSGRRNPTPENLLRLADVVERRGARLAKLAERLRKAAETG